MKMHKPILPKCELSIFEKLGFGKMRNRDTKTKILTSQVILDLRKVINPHLKAQNYITIFFSAPKI